MASLDFMVLMLGIVSVVKCSFEPLILSPLVKDGKIKEAQEAARVVPDMNGEKSYSGFFTVDEKCENNLFFWFFPAQNNSENAPVLLWLNGGPGSSSLIGMFEEIGPFNYVKKKKFVKNEYSWTKDNNVIFLDQPVGTGFSFTRKGCYCDNMTAMAEQVYSFLQQFYLMYPNLENNKFLITGESFGGHYIPAIASEIHKRNAGSKKINLIGYAIGNAAVDTRCEKFANFMYSNGMIDAKTREEMASIEDDIAKAIDAGNYSKASIDDDKRFGIILESKLPTVYNVMYDRETEDFWQVLIKRYDVRKQIHVGNATYTVSADAPWDHMRPNAMYGNTMSYIEELLNTKQYIIGFYSGLLDLRIPYSSTECFLRHLKWDGAHEYLKVNRTAWYDGDRLAGWFKVAGNLVQVVFRGAGHMVPTDQPRASLAFISAVINSKPGETPLSTLNTEKQR